MKNIGFILLPFIGFGQITVESLDSVFIQTPEAFEIVEIGFHDLSKTFLPSEWLTLNSLFYNGVYIENPNPNEKKIIQQLIIEGIGSEEKNAQIEIRLYEFDPTINSVKDILVQKKIYVPKGSGLLKIPLERPQNFPVGGIIFALKAENENSSIILRLGKTDSLKKIYTIFPDKLVEGKWVFGEFMEEKNIFMLGVSVNQY